MPARNVPFWENGCSCVVAVEVALTGNRRCGGGGEMACLALPAV